MVQKTSSVILDVASKLFSKKGFNGTSIREIASKANVNIAAISYHFESKEKLFFKVFLKAYSKFETIFSDIPTSLSVADFTFEIYKKFLQNNTNSLNSFRMLLTQDIKYPKDKDMSFPLLPPGGKVLFSVITKEIGVDIPESKRYWMACLIFQNIFFAALFENLKIMKNSLKKYQSLVQMSKKEEIYNFVEIILFKYKKLKFFK